MTLRDKPITEQIRWLADCIYGNKEYGPKIRPAMRDIAMICAEFDVKKYGGKRRIVHFNELKQYMIDPNSKLRQKILQGYKSRSAMLSDAAYVLASESDYNSTMDVVVMVGIASKHGLDLTQVKVRMNSLLDELEL